MTKINDDYILSKGYKEYPPSHFHNSSVVKCFQKRFDDDYGKKYFIDINKWYWGDVVPEYRKDKWYEEYTYEFCVQLYQKGTHNAIDINFHQQWTLEEVEVYIEKQFALGIYDYYEDWEGNRGVNIE